MKVTLSLWALALNGLVQGATEAASSRRVQQVAIIGAGAAGSSTAYHIRKFADQDDVPVNITIFEKTDHIGGRTLTVNAYGDATEPVELGASIFIKLNEILWNATEQFGLPLQDPDTEDDGLLAVWDGEKFVYQQDYKSWGWWNIVKLFWKYGTAPYRTQKLMQATIAKFLSLYRSPYFPFRSLTTRAYELELTYVTGQTGQQFLTQNSVSDLFAHDIVQASTRVNYVSNLAHIHGLDTMVSMAPEGATQVMGGNWRIFNKMVVASGANVELNSSVTSISLASRDQSPAKYTIKTKSTASASSDEVEEPAEFDHVVIATPWQFSKIHADDNVLQHSIDEIPYVKLHVTLFASPFLMSPAFFNLPPATRTPTTVLTTLAPNEEPSYGAGKAGFFSISTHKRIINPKTGLHEYLYKVFSPEELTPKFLSELLGADVPNNFVYPAIDGELQHTMVEPISWYYPHVFHSYPKALPRVTFQDPIVGDGLYYTSGMESFISCMETSALMGMNVARLVIDDVLGLKTGMDVKIGEVYDDGEQKPVGGGSSKIDEL